MDFAFGSKNPTEYEGMQLAALAVGVSIVDCSYVTIYAKNPEVLTAVYEKAIASEYENVAYITDENDCRTTLKAF